MKKMKWTKGMLGLACMAVVFYMSALSALAAEGKVIANTAKIRAEANTSSEVVGSTVKDKVIDILSAVTDSAGTVWYRVAVANNGYGYIRSDLVETSETITPTASATTAPAASEAPKPDPTVPTSIGEQQAVIKSESNVRIRSGASTQHDTVTSLPNGTAITLIGEANDSAGNKWYQLTCTYNNRSIEGYVRSDLITIGATAGETTDPAEGTETEEPQEGETPEGETPEGEQPAEEAPAEEPQEEEHKDYEVVYTQNDAGEYEYYLYDNINGTRQKLGELLNVVNVVNETSVRLQSQIDRDKIIIIILAGVIVLLFVAITILIFKLRELYYDDYDEDDEEEEEEEPAPVRKKVRRTETYEEAAPVKKKRPVDAPEHEKAPQPRPKTRENQELHAASKKEQTPKPATRKPQNFLVDEDEFEFEFLNMDDKDL